MRCHASIACVRAIEKAASLAKGNRGAGMNPRQAHDRLRPSSSREREFVKGSTTLCGAIIAPINRSESLCGFPSAIPVRDGCLRELSACIYAQATRRVAPFYPATNPACCGPARGGCPAGCGVATASRTGAAGGQRRHCLPAYPVDASGRTDATGATLATIQPGDGGGNRHAAGRRHSPDRHRHRSLCAGGRRDYHCGGGACDHRGSRQRVCPDSGGIPGASAGNDSGASGPAPGIVTRFHLRFRGLGGGECSQPHPEQHRPIP